MVSSFSSMADINSSAFMMSASMSSISSESLINRKIRIIIADHCMLIKGFSNLVSRATCISAPQFECCWGYPAKSANGQDSPKTLPSWFSAKLNQARIWVRLFNNWQQIKKDRNKINGVCSLSSTLRQHYKRAIVVIGTKTSRASLTVIFRPDICHFFSTNVLLGSIFRHMKARKLWQKLHKFCISEVSD